MCPYKYSVSVIYRSEVQGGWNKGKWLETKSKIQKVYRVLITLKAISCGWPHLRYYPRFHGSSKTSLKWPVKKRTEKVVIARLGGQRKLACMKLSPCTS